MNRPLRLTLVLFILAACAKAAIAQPPARVAGEWDLTVSSPQGARDVKATFKEESGKLSGSLQAGGRSIPFEGTLTGKEVKFSFTISNQGTDMVITMTGDVEGDSIKGKADFGALGAGDWTAKRAGAGSTPVAAATPAGSQGGDLTGDWDVTITSPLGTNTVQATFQHNGEKLGGVFKSARGHLPFEGSVTGKEVKLLYTIQYEGNPMVITMTGTAEGNSIKGPADFGGLATGDWSAQRKTTTASPGGPAPAAGASSGDKVDVSGTWTFEVETSAGSGSPTFTFTQQGEKLSGQYKGAFGEAPLTGTVQSNTITFSFKVSVGGTEGTVTYFGTIAKDSMKGTATLGELGSATWTAKRQ
jgi:hypothetical protein